MNAIALLIASMLAVPTAPTQSPLPGAEGRPHWAGASVPDTVWLLVEAATEADDEGRRRELLREADDHARAAVTGHEEDLGRRYALAVVLGLRCNNEGGRTRVRVASRLLSELEVVLGLDPQHAGARHMLGRLHAGVRRMNRLTRWVATGLLGGDQLGKATWDAAEEHLAFAETHEPTVADHHLQLALLYRDTDRPERAAKEIGHVMDLQAHTAHDLAVHAEAMEVWTELGL